jgi:hypothetical protein
MVLFPIALSLAAVGPPQAISADAVLAAEGGACLATGYCSLPGPGGAPPGGLMYLALGLLGTGVTVLKTRKETRGQETRDK